MDSELSFLQEHTVFKTTIEATFQFDKDADLLIKRLDILGAEVVAITPQGESVTYTILSHFPVTEDTVNALMMESHAQIIKADGTVVLNAKDILSVKCDITSLSLKVPQSISEKNISGKLIFVIGDKEHFIWATTRFNNAQCLVKCTLSETNQTMLHAFAISMHPEDYIGNVNIKVIKTTERVTDKMQS
jgi:hypothetical protein